MLIASTNIQPPAFLYNCFCMRAIDFSQPAGGSDYREGYGVRKEAMQDSQPSAEGDWIFRARSGYLSCWPQFCALHGYTLQSNGMQERLAASPRRAAAGLRFALHIIDRGKLRGNEARDGIGERSARPAEGNHAV